MMNDPIPFVLTGEDGKSLSIDPRARAALAKIDKPLVVLSVVGMYRTGKSFLLNRLMNRTDGFPLGATVEAKTKGIWMWVRDFPDDPTKALLLLDTEGLHDPGKASATHDAQIFTLTVLLSSVLVYNIKGTIDASSLDGLHLATELTSHISTKAGAEEETGEDFSKFFPVLVWAVRDHHLKLSVDGKEITAKDYLENCLTMKKSKRKADMGYNNLRASIRDFFKERHCFVFPLPTSMNNLHNLDKMQLSELDPEFISAGDRFAEFVTHRSPCKMVRGKALNGGMFVSLAEQYVEAIAAGNINIESAYESMIFSENEKSKAAAIESFKAVMNGLELPLEVASLDDANEKAQEAATMLFLRTAVDAHKNRNCFEEMTEELTKIFEAIAEKNLSVSTEVCSNLLEDLYAPIDLRLGRGEFIKAGGHQMYKEEVQKVEMEYTDLPKSQKGPSAEEALLLFQRKKISPQLGSLLQTDQALSEEKKKSEQLKREVKIKEEEKTLLEKQSVELHHQQEEMRKTFEANLRRQTEEMEEQHKQAIEVLEMNLRREKEESERLATEGFKQEADMMKEQLEENRKAMEEKEKRHKHQMAEMVQSLTKQMNNNAPTHQHVIKHPTISGASVVGALNVGHSVASTAKAFASLPYNVTFQLTMENFTNQNLFIHQNHVHSGHISEAPQPVSPGTKEGLAGHKTSSTATGCAGTVSWKIGNTGRMLVVMYSVPYSHDWHSNWCGAGVFVEQDTSGFFERMYNGSEVGFKRKEFYNNRQPLSYKDTDFSLHASMGSSHKPTVEVVCLNHVFPYNCTFSSGL